MSQSVQVSDRRKAILLLAGSLYDFTAGPSQGRSPASSRRERGRPAPHKKEPCATCGGDKVVKDKFGRETPCTACEGRGWFLVDPMMEKQPTKWSDPPASSFTRRALCYLCGGEGVLKGERCGTCDGSGRVSVPIHRDETRRGESEGGSWWDRAIDRRNELGSYHRLDVALAELARRSVHRWRVFNAVYVLKTSSEGYLSGTEATLLGEAVRDIDKMMPRVIMVPAEVLAGERRVRQDAPKGKLAKREDLIARDALIRSRFAGGHGDSARVIAKEFALSVGRVNEIVYPEREVA